VSIIQNKVRNFSNNRFYLLDGMRGVLCFSIVADHLYFDTPDLVRYSQGFNSFVDFFFVLSGFVLAPAILSIKAGSKKKFLVGRMIRLYPMLIPVFFTLALVQWVPFLSKHLTGFPPTAPLTFVGSLLLLQIFWGATVAINTPMWSLSAEFYTNMIATIFPLKQKYLIPISLGLILEIVGLLISDRYNLEWGVFFYTIGIGRAIVGFYLGIILRKDFNTKNHEGSIGTVLIILMILSLNFFLLNSSSYFIIFAAPIFFYLVRELASFNESNLPKWIVRMFSYFARISYGVYLWHTIIGTMAIPFFVLKYLPFDLNGIPKSLFIVTLTIIILVIVTEASIRLVETPIRRTAYTRLRIFKEN